MYGENVMGLFCFSCTDGDYYVSPSLMGDYCLPFTDGGLLCLSITDGVTIMSPLH
jgi:hypothetical protein